MYLVLIPDKDLDYGNVLSVSNSINYNQSYLPKFVEDIKIVSDLMIKYKSCKVYKLDSLTEVARIDVTMDEVTKEMLHG